MLTRCDYAITWQYNANLAIGDDIYIEVGAPSSGSTIVFLKPLPFFSIDVYTDDIVQVDIETGHNVAALAVMATLFCAGVLQHNTVYNLAPPFNRDGFIILTGNWCRLRVRNVTGNIVSPFTLNARLWR